MQEEDSIFCYVLMRADNIRPYEIYAHCILSRIRQTEKDAIIISVLFNLKLYIMSVFFRLARLWINLIEGSILCVCDRVKLSL